MSIHRACCCNGDCESWSIYWRAKEPTVGTWVSGASGGYIRRRHCRRLLVWENRAVASFGDADEPDYVLKTQYRALSPVIGGVPAGFETEVGSGIRLDYTPYLWPCNKGGWELVTPSFLPTLDNLTAQMAAEKPLPVSGTYDVLAYGRYFRFYDNDRGYSTDEADGGCNIYIVTLAKY